MNEEANYSTTFFPKSGKDYALTTRSSDRGRRTVDPELVRWRCGFDYFVLREAQDAIGERFGLSRPTVARYIQAMREHFTLAPDFAVAPNLTADLEARLRERFEPKEAVVAPIWAEDYSLTTRLLGRAASLTFERLVSETATTGRRLSVGIAGGETMLHLALAARPLGIPLDLYPMVIGPHPDTELSAAAIAGIMARRLVPRQSEILGLARHWFFDYLSGNFPRTMEGSQCKRSMSSG